MTPLSKTTAATTKSITLDLRTKDGEVHIKGATRAISNVEGEKKLDHCT